MGKNYMRYLDNNIEASGVTTVNTMGMVLLLIRTCYLLLFANTGNPNHTTAIPKPVLLILCQG